MNEIPDLVGKLHGLAERVAGVRVAEMLSVDGLVIAFHGTERDSADHLAAITAGMLSLTRKVGVIFAGGDGVRQVAFDITGLRLHAMSAGRYSALAVLADGEADPDALGREMKRFIEDVQPFLSVQPRTPGVTQVVS